MFSWDGHGNSLITPGPVYLEHCLICTSDTNKPVHEFLVLITYTKCQSLNMHVQLSSGAIYLKLGMSLYLHHYFVYARSEGSGETVLMHSLAWTLTARICGKELALM